MSTPAKVESQLTTEEQAGKAIGKAHGAIAETGHVIGQKLEKAAEKAQEAKDDSSTWIGDKYEGKS